MLYLVQVRNFKFILIVTTHMLTPMLQATMMARIPSAPICKFQTSSWAISLTILGHTKVSILGLFSAHSLRRIFFLLCGFYGKCGACIVMKHICSTDIYAPSIPTTVISSLEANAPVRRITIEVGVSRGVVPPQSECHIAPGRLAWALHLFAYCWKRSSFGIRVI